MLSPPYSTHADLLDGRNVAILDIVSSTTLSGKGNESNQISAIPTSSLRGTGSPNLSFDEDEEDADDDDDTDRDDNPIDQEVSKNLCDAQSESNVTDNVTHSDSKNLMQGTGRRSGSASSLSFGIIRSKRSAAEAFDSLAEDSIAVVEDECDDVEEEYERLQSSEVSSVGTSSSSPMNLSRISLTSTDLSMANGIRRKGPWERRMTTCWDALKTNPVKYLRQERNLLEMYPLRRHSWAGPGMIGYNGDDSSDSSGSSSLRGSPNPSSVGSGLGVTASTGRGRGRKPGRPGSVGASSRGRRRTSVVLTNDSSIANSSGASDLSRGRSTSGSDIGGGRSGQANSDGSSPLSGTSGGSGVRVHDLSYHQLEDYSPDVSLLPPGKSLRAEWKGAPMDLSGDPDLVLLHPAEAHLASVLRLPCEVYLDSKRRLFAEKVHRLKQGLPFRRTDSQKACRIDVNKASRLFGAFEKIGWLDDGLFIKFLG